MKTTSEDIREAILRVLTLDWTAGLDVHKEVEYVFQHAITYQAVYDALVKLESEHKIESEEREGGSVRNWLAFRVYRKVNA
jgi:DNA-binding PadR family transcriptional regulator